MNLDDVISCDGCNSKIVKTKIIDICMKNMCIWGKKRMKKKNKKTATHKQVL
jgi:hypothetical protein